MCDVFAPNYDWKILITVDKHVDEMFTSKYAVNEISQSAG
jgi:hypothetical protein